jgi:hypothetical protein
MSDWDSLIMEAQRKGFTTRRSEEHEGWLVITPARPRRPTQELGSFKDQRAAWRSAAYLAQEFD